jgi:hypothetical protein
MFLTQHNSPVGGRDHMHAMDTAEATMKKKENQGDPKQKTKQTLHGCSCRS